MLKLYNSYSSSLEEVELNKKEVKIYLCGPTVQSSPHLGHGRSAVVFDFLVRYLKYLEYKVTFVRNITDIDDKIIEKSLEEDISFVELGTRVTKEFQNAYEELNCLSPDKEPKATEFIDQIIKYIKKLIENKFAYITKSGVYYEISKFDDYLLLSGRTKDDVISGTRVEIEEDKKTAEDFALWKISKENEPYWESPWGNGRPGWHIECSSMIEAILGKTIDIHCGGNDLIFPHHENEIAQSKGAYPNEPFVKYWLHNGMLNLSGKKMSKSEGNIKLLNDYIDDISFSNKGGTSFVELPLDNPTVNFYSDFFDQVQLSYLSINQNNQISVESLESTSSEQNYNFNTSDILSHVFIVSPIYNGVEFQSINFDVSLSNIILGDANFDQIINVLDVVILVNFAIGSNQPTDLDIEVCDFNFDGIINVLDVVQLINLILT